MITTVICELGLSTYAGLHISARMAQHYQVTNPLQPLNATPDYTLINAASEGLDTMLSRPLDVYPFNLVMLLVFIAIGSAMAMFSWLDYHRKKNTMPDEEYGTGGFDESTNFFDQEFFWNPKYYNMPKFKKMLYAPIRFLGKLFGGGKKAVEKEEEPEEEKEDIVFPDALEEQQKKQEAILTGTINE